MKVMRYYWLLLFPTLCFGQGGFVMPGWVERYDEVFHIRIQHPEAWEQVDEDPLNPRFEGDDGFVQYSAISPIAESNTLEKLCEDEARSSHDMYGSRPVINYQPILDQQTCFVLPSGDQSRRWRDQAAFIIRSPQAIAMDDSVYDYLIIRADKEHVDPIARLLDFI